MARTETEFETNADGSIIAKLVKPFKLNGEEITRVTIVEIKGKHLMGLPPLDSIGQYMLLASRVVLPAGAIEEMGPLDATRIANRAFEIVTGKAVAADQASKPGEATSP